LNISHDRSGRQIVIQSKLNAHKSTLFTLDSHELRNTA